MKKLNISSIVINKFIPHHSKNQILERKNILSRDFSTIIINEKWISDITNMHIVEDGWYDLASVMDLHTRKIIGYFFSKLMDANLVKASLKMIMKLRGLTAQSYSTQM